MLDFGLVHLVIVFQNGTELMILQGVGRIRRYILVALIKQNPE